MIIIQHSAGKFFGPQKVTLSVVEQVHAKITRVYVILYYLLLAITPATSTQHYSAHCENYW